MRTLQAYNQGLTSACINTIPDTKYITKSYQLNTYNHTNKGQMVVMSANIHPVSIQLIGVGLWGAGADIEQDWGTIDKLPVYHRANT